jgi:hypothetical protein
MFGPHIEVLRSFSILLQSQSMLIKELKDIWGLIRLKMLGDASIALDICIINILL